MRQWIVQIGIRVHMFRHALSSSSCHSFRLKYMYLEVQRHQQLIDARSKKSVSNILKVSVQNLNLINEFNSGGRKKCERQHPMLVVMKIWGLDSRDGSNHKLQVWALNAVWTNGWCHNWPFSSLSFLWSVLRGIHVLHLRVRERKRSFTSAHLASCKTKQVCF